MDPYGLLIAHAEQWAAKAKRALDADLLGTALSLRDSQDRMPGTSWPAGSAAHLMTVRWPGHGPLGVPDTDVLVATLETFWRFLRATGRMASGSAEPSALAREARRAIPTMRERCADPAAFGATKGLQAYGHEIGISLDEAESLEELQERLTRITDAWNALPIEERQARMPGPVGAGSVVSRELSEQASEWLAGLDLTEHTAEHRLDGELSDPDEEEALPVQDPRVVARQIRTSGFVLAIERLVAWVGESGRPATKTGVLRPAVAREAIAELGLDNWMRTTLHQEPAPWRSAGEHLGLDRLFLPAMQVGFLEHRGGRIVACPERPGTNEEWTIAGVTLLVALHRRAGWDDAARPLLGVLLGLEFGDLRTRADIVAWWRSAPGNYLARMPYEGPAQGRAEWEQLRHELSDGYVTRTLAFWEETGIWRHVDRRLRLTELGLDFTRLLIQLEEHGGHPSV